MISVTYIQRNIAHLDTKYRSAASPLSSLLYSKLAVIELGGWIETSMDDLIYRAGKKLKHPVNVKELKDSIVGKTWGFDYKSNFRRMMIQVVGLIAVEKIEKIVDAGRQAAMVATLGILKTARNDVAHTYVKHPHFAAAIPAPSVISGYFAVIHAGLQAIEAAMRKLKLL